MTPEQQLDYVLYFIKSKINLSIQITKSYIWDLRVAKEQKETGINDAILTEIINTLIEDGYVRESTNFPFILTATFKGLVFEGYVQKKINEEKEKINIAEIQRTQIKQAKQLNTLTWFIAIGSIIAAIYYFIQICKSCSQ